MSIEINDVYRCSVCGNMVEVVHVGGGELVCCGKPMIKQVANTVEASTEKHIPVVEKKEDGYLIKVGAQEHPSLPSHYIEFIEVLFDNNKIGRKYLAPGQTPEAFVQKGGNIIEARAYCNIHGLWSNKK